MARAAAAPANPRANRKIPPLPSESQTERPFAAPFRLRAAGLAAPSPGRHPDARPFPVPRPLPLPTGREHNNTTNVSMKTRPQSKRPNPGARARTSLPVKLSKTACAIKWLWIAALPVSIVTGVWLMHCDDWNLAWEQPGFRVVLIASAVLLAILGIMGNVVIFNQGATRRLMGEIGGFLGGLTVIWAVLFLLLVGLAVVAAVIAFSLAKNGDYSFKNMKVVGQRTCPKCGHTDAYFEKGQRCTNCGFPMT